MCGERLACDCYFCFGITLVRRGVMGHDPDSLSLHTYRSFNGLILSSISESISGSISEAFPSPQCPLKDMYVQQGGDIVIFRNWEGLEGH